MITDAIINALLGGINALLSLLPSYELPDGRDSEFGYQLGALVSQADHIFPLATITKIIGLAFALRILMASWDLIVFIYHQFWGSN